jgi:predicted kinase
MENMSRQLIIMQGASGSGKSTFVSDRKHLNDIVLSTDNYFVDDDGIYRFDESKLDHYHMKTLQACINAMQDATRNNERDCTIWLDNTNCNKEDVAPYLSFAKFNKFEVIYIRMAGDFESKAPDDVVNQQRNNLSFFNYD